MIVQILLYVSAIFIILGAIGLFRFPDFYTRVHAATMITVGGVCLSLFALAVSTFWSMHTVKILLIMLFILITTPTSSHAIARAAYNIGIEPKNLVKNQMD